jgi:hypothetical protein
MTDQGKTYGSMTLSKRSKQKLINSSIDLWLAWGIDYDAMYPALDKHREAASKSNEEV